jgi:hypothetical protein
MNCRWHANEKDSLKSDASTTKKLAHCVCQISLPWTQPSESVQQQALAWHALHGTLHAMLETPLADSPTSIANGPETAKNQAAVQPASRDLVSHAQHSFIAMQQPALKAWIPLSVTD